MARFEDDPSGQTLSVADDHDQILRRFHDDVNMAPAELEKWLQTDDSKAVGDSDGDAESTGHRSGRRIVEILRTRKADLSDSDFDHMKKVSGYVARHLEQRPKDPEESRWRYSLMNWGHDPMK
jgi:hypothetical protein